MIVPPRPTHSFRILVVWNNIVAIRELFVTKCAYASLLPDLAVEQIPHLGWRSKFAISTRVVRIIDPLHPHLYDSGLVFFWY